MNKIKIYRDSGASIKFTESFAHYINFYQYPYDSADRPKKQKVELAVPSEVTWETAHVTWDEATYKWKDCNGSEIYDSLIKIVGKPNLNDALHLDSAYKSGCHIFLTSDKKDIYTKKTEIESLCKFKIFFHHDGQQITDYIQKLLPSTTEGQ